METISPSPSPKELATAFFEGGKESPFARTVAEGVGPLRSFAAWTAYNVSGGRFRGDLGQYFKKPENKPLSVEISDAPLILDEIDKRLSGDDRVVENFIGAEAYRKWVALKGKIEGFFGQRIGVTDYVLYDRQRGDTYLFVGDKTDIVPLKVKSEDFSGNALMSEYRSGRSIGTIQSPRGQGDLKPAIEMETAIAAFAGSINTDPSNLEVRRISSVANDFDSFRDILFGREEQMFTELRHMGVWGVGELQTMNQALFARAICLDKDSGRVVIDQDLAGLWLRTRMISLHDETASGESKANDEMLKHATEKIYFKVVKTYLKENPALVDAFLNSPEYTRFAMEFKDKNLSSLGLTERGVAIDMLSNVYLSMFEGGKLEDSSSQAYLARIPGFHKSLRAFIITNRDVAPPLPDVVDAKRDQPGELSLLFSLLKNREYPFTKFNLSEKRKSELVDMSEKSLVKIRHMIKRNAVDRGILSRLDSTPVVTMERGTYPTMIANVGLARVSEEKKFTVSSWLKADLYIPDGRSLMPIKGREQVPSGSEIVEVVKGVFNGKVEPGVKAFESQEKRIFGAAPLLFAFLQRGEMVPDNIRQFMTTLSSPELAVKLLERMGPITENETLIVNRFFPDGLSSFQGSAEHRYVFDFLRGVETNLILLQSKSPREAIIRKFGGQWKNSDFSGVDPGLMQKAIENTLKDASHRIRVLNHEAGEKRETLKDYQEFFEKALGWDTFDMWFLRWDKFWDVWHTLGGTWDCICFSRKTIFNPRVLQQW